MTTTQIATKFSTAAKLAARFDVGFERDRSDASWATTDTLRGAEADALVADLASAGIEASKAYDTDDRSQAWVYATLDEADLATAIPPTRGDRIAALAAAVGNDGTGDLGVIVDHAPADATTADLAEIVREAREDALVEREREAR